MGDLPTPRNPTDRLLVAIHDRLGELLDRFPAPPPEKEGGQVELREPSVPPAARESAGGTDSAGGSGVKARRPTRTRPTKPLKEPADKTPPAAAKPSPPRRRTTTPKPTSPKD